MEGRLYTAGEIFDALREATKAMAEEQVEQFEPDSISEYHLITEAVAATGADIAYRVAHILKFDKEQLKEYCKRELERLEEEE